MNHLNSNTQQDATERLLLFTDLDGCLLNKSDYDYSAALPTLDRLATAGVPVILCSSKTRTEMKEIARELALRPAPMTCENGGFVFLADRSTDNAAISGHQRTEILSVLAALKDQFAFRSFADLGLEGVMRATDLPEARARAACDRQGTEPLLWDDDPQKIEAFRTLLETNDLTLTQGGRFWHVATGATKGSAMQEVLEFFRSRADPPQTYTSIAVGDSPIDQSMLDIADIPIGIPQPNGDLKVLINTEHGIIANKPGAGGWAQSVGIVLDRLGIP